MPATASLFFNERVGLVPEAGDCHAVPLSVVTPVDGITYEYRLASIAGGVGLSGELFTDAACTAAIDDLAAMPIALPDASVYYIPAHRKASYNLGFPAKLLADETLTYEAADSLQMRWSAAPGSVSFGIASTVNDVCIAVLGDFEACVEDTPCVFTLATSDPDPDDTHDYLLEQTVPLTTGTMHQFDAGQAGNVGALMDPVAQGAPVLVADTQHRVVYVPNANLHTFGAQTAAKPAFRFRVMETNTSSAFSDSLDTPHFDVAPADDAPVTANSNVQLASDFPVGDAEGGVRVLAPAVSQIDFPADALAITFTTLPALGFVRNGAVPVVLGEEIVCTNVDCGAQFFWEAPTAGGALGSNTVVASIGYTVRDIAPFGAPHDGLGLDSGAEALITFTTNPSPALVFVGVVSPLPAGFDEGESTSTADIVVRFAQPDTGPAPAPYLGVMAFPTAGALGDNDDRTHTGGVTFPPSAHRDGDAALVSFFRDGQTDCAPLAVCPGLLENQGVFNEPNLRYSGVCDENFCDFTITIRACNTAEKADDCDPDFAGNSVLMLQAHTEEGGVLSVADVPFTVVNDHAEVRLPGERTNCSALSTNSFVLGAATIPWVGSFCVPEQGSISGNAIAIADHDLFQLAPFNDGYADGAGTTWRASIGYYTGCSESAQTCEPLTLGGSTDFLAESVTFSLVNATGTEGVTVTNNPAVSTSTAATELIIEANDLLALRRELYWGVHFNAEISFQKLTGNAIIMKLARNDGSGFADIAVFGLRLSGSSAPNDGQLTDYPEQE